MTDRYLSHPTKRGRSGSSSDGPSRKTSRPDTMSGLKTRQNGSPTASRPSRSSVVRRTVSDMSAITHAARPIGVSRIGEDSPSETFSPADATRQVSQETALANLISIILEGSVARESFNAARQQLEDAHTEFDGLSKPILAFPAIGEQMKARLLLAEKRVSKSENELNEYKRSLSKALKAAFQSTGSVPATHLPSEEISHEVHQELLNELKETKGRCDMFERQMTTLREHMDDQIERLKRDCLLSVEKSRRNDEAINQHRVKIESIEHSYKTHNSNYETQNNPLQEQARLTKKLQDDMASALEGLERRVTSLEAKAIDRQV